MMVNETVQIHSRYNSMGGMFIYEKFITGTVVKVNKKSIRVHMTHVKCTTNGKLTREYDIDKTATFDFWKTIENKQFGKNAGRTQKTKRPPQSGQIKMFPNSMIPKSEGNIKC